MLDMRTLRRIAVAALALVLGACVSTNAVKLGVGPARPPVPEDAVAIYRTADQVPGRYEEVALLNASGESIWTNEAKMLNAMRRKAGQMGANAIILDAISEPGAGAKVAAAVLGVGAERKGKAIAIYVLPAASPVAVPADTASR
ncbi:MAG TPA: hypothetical protein VFS08_06775 [Gemmatimonadaceae bacterium]|nr:hypothetical protein [Gemmatimonadaceae bacterium]